MIKIRRSSERGQLNLAWLHSQHTFSFADYYDPEYLGFRDLRVINQDILQPGQGFAPHSHQDMEILTYVLRGTIIHKDNLGHKIELNSGEIQCMSAGSGITHSEYNASENEILEFLQIWIIPNEKSLQPQYQQISFKKTPKKLQLLASPTGEEASLLIHQDAKLYTTLLPSKETLAYTISPKRYIWLQIISGQFKLDDEYLLNAGDGVAISHKNGVLRLEAITTSEFLLFDLN